MLLKSVGAMEREVSSFSPLALHPSANSEHHGVLHLPLAACFSTLSSHQRYSFPFLSFTKKHDSVKGSSRCRSQCENAAGNWQVWILTWDISKRAPVEAREQNAVSWLAFPPEGKSNWDLVKAGSCVVKSHILNMRLGTYSLQSRGKSKWSPLSDLGLARVK